MEIELLRKVFEEYIPFNKLLGFKATHLEPGRACIEVPWRPEFVGDPMRPAMHGGLISALADTAGGLAIWSKLDNQSARVSTIDIRVDYLSPGKLELVCATAEIVRVGNHVGVADVRVFHPSDEKKTVATAKGVYAIRVPKTRA